jgi:molecular chaperone GrpE
MNDDASTNDDDGSDAMTCDGDSFPEEECLIVGIQDEAESIASVEVAASFPRDEDLAVTLVIPPPVVASIATDDSNVERPIDKTSQLAAGIASLEAAIGKRLDGLQSAFDRELRAESTREKVVDRLHAELQEYKNDFLLNVLRPVFVDLIQLHDDIGKIVQTQEPANDDSARLLTLMSGFQQGIEDILYRQGVEPFALDDDAFDPRKQRAFSTVATDDPSLSKKVAARLRKGFRSGDKVIRPEVVSVYSLKR